MFLGEVIGYIGSDAKKTEKGCSFSVSHKFKENGTDKTLWISCFINYDTKVQEYLKRGTLVYVIGDMKVSTFIREGGEAVPQITMNVHKVKLLSGKDKE